MSFTVVSVVHVFTSPGLKVWKVRVQFKTSSMLLSDEEKSFELSTHLAVTTNSSNMPSPVTANQHVSAEKSARRVLGSNPIG